MIKLTRIQGKGDVWVNFDFLALMEREKGHNGKTWTRLSFGGFSAAGSGILVDETPEEIAALADWNSRP